MSKEETTATKGRRTKLSKKTVEELVNIILRKDDVEKSLREKLNNSQDKYNETINTLSTDIDDVTKQYKTLKETYNKLRDNYNSVAAMNQTLDIKAKEVYNRLVDANNRVFKLTISNAIAYLLLIISIMVIIIF